MMDLNRQQRWIKIATWRFIDQLELLHKPTTTRGVAIVVTRGFGVMLSDIRSRSSCWIDVAARRITMALACRYTDKSYPQIARFLNRDHHACVIGACRQYDDLIDSLLRDANLPVPPRRVRREPPPQQSKLPADLFLTLKALNQWSVDDIFTHPEDLHPHIDSNVRMGRLWRLQRSGLAEFDASDCKARWWRITLAGRSLLKRLLSESQSNPSLPQVTDGGKTLPAMRGPDHRSCGLVRLSPHSKSEHAEAA